MADLFAVLTMMAIPAGFLLTVRYLIIRQNRLAAREELAVLRAVARRP
ncbi:MAG: hypothetical protein WAL26_22455 [Mycobacterium sp.]